MTLSTPPALMRTRIAQSRLLGLGQRGPAAGCPSGPGLDAVPQQEMEEGRLYQVPVVQVTGGYPSTAACRCQAGCVTASGHSLGPWP